MSIKKNFSSSQWSFSIKGSATKNLELSVKIFNWNFCDLVCTEPKKYLQLPLPLTGKYSETRIVILGRALFLIKCF